MPQEKVRWEVYKRDGQGLDFFLGETLAVSERQACNNVRMRRWGRNMPADSLGFSLFAREKYQARQLRLPT